MKKKTVLWAILLFYSLGIFAEQSALLYGNGKVRTFSGENAFRDAYEAAVDGDTITLSPGIFYNPKGDMTKTLYICGSGAYGSDTENTIIDYSLTIRGNDTKIEGIAFQRKGYTNTVYVNADNVSFSRCFINEIDYNDNTSMYSVEHGRTVLTAPLPSRFIIVLWVISPLDGHGVRALILIQRTAILSTALFIRVQLCPLPSSRTISLRHTTAMD